MALSSGMRLGPYEVQEPLGAGGMGEVYRARDTRLDRTVAVKVLPAHLASSPDLRQRLEREAKALSSLSHPNICGLFDIGQQDGLDYIVMEHLEGETLASRLAKGPLSVEELLRYSIQIADALDKAHRKGVVHRDLKPGNVMLTKSGAKLLDFGLAKSADKTLAGGGDVSHSPTASRPLTAEGSLMGTFQYMSPEQLEGKEADARSDIFALGCVLHEMATGQRAFAGASRASLIGAIMREQPPAISTIQPLTPPAFDRVVKACLAKDPEDRWQTAHDVVLELTWVQEGGSQAGLPAPVSARRRRREGVAWLGFAAALLAAAAFAIAFVKRAPTTPPIVRFQLMAPEGFTNVGTPAVSPDGRMIAFDGRDAGNATRVWIRSLDSVQPRALQGTEGALRPFWSPDSRFVGFMAGGKLKKVEVTGGPPQTLADLPSGADGTWSAAGVILMDGQERDPILRIPASGGEPKPEVEFGGAAGGGQGVGWPQFLPDGRHFLYVELGKAGSTNNQLFVRALDSKDKKLVLETASRVQYVPGYLLYVKEDTLVAQRFDVRNQRVVGEAVPISEGLGIDNVGAADFNASETGTLVYRAGQTRNRQLLWYDRSGRELKSEGGQGEWGDVWFSPDGTRMAVDQSDRTAADVWVRDLGRGTNTRLTFDAGMDRAPIWSPDGRRVVFSSNRAGAFDLYEKDAAGTSEERLLLKDEHVKYAGDWSRDGRYLLYWSQGNETGWDIGVLPMQGEAKPHLIFSTRFNELRPSLSPDGRYLAYQSDESGGNQVYVVNFPEPTGKWQVSTNGGREPMWSATGREIFYLSEEDRSLMTVSVNAGASFSAGTPEKLFTPRVNPIPMRGHYRPTADGQRFLFLSPLGRDSITPMTVVLNWTEALKR
jgi:Tol biopolymer transport system component